MSTCSWRRFFFSASISSHACTAHASLWLPGSAVPLPHNLLHASFLQDVMTTLVFTLQAARSDIHDILHPAAVKQSAGHDSSQREVARTSAGQQPDISPAGAVWQSPDPGCRWALWLQCPCGGPFALQTPLPAAPCTETSTCSALGRGFSHQFHATFLTCSKAHTLLRRASP